MAIRILHDGLTADGKIYAAGQVELSPGPQLQMISKPDFRHFKGTVVEHFEPGTEPDPEPQPVEVKVVLRPQTDPEWDSFVEQVRKAMAEREADNAFLRERVRSLEAHIEELESARVPDATPGPDSVKAEDSTAEAPPPEAETAPPETEVEPEPAKSGRKK